MIKKKHMNTHTLNALAYELELVLSDPDSKLSDEAERAISYTVSALRAQPTASAEQVQELREALGRAHQTAMEQTLKARIPECAEFAGIAQDLGFVLDALGQEDRND